MTDDTRRAQIAARLEGESVALEALIATCEHALHAAPIGCPYCKRDTRQRDLFREAAAELSCADAEVGRLTRAQEALRQAARCIVETFKRDETAGYRNRDRQFTIEILEKALTAPSEAASSPPELTFSRALVRRVAAYVRGFYPPPPPQGEGFYPQEHATLQHVADMIEAQEHALISSTPFVGEAASSHRERANG